MDLKMTSSSSSSSSQRRLRLEEQYQIFDSSASSSSSCDNNNINNVCALNSTGTLPTIHLATWATVAPTLQAYVNAYQQTHPHAPQLSLTILDSIDDLQTSAVSDLKRQQQQDGYLYDGHVMPPLMVGPLVEQQGLLALDEFRDESFYQDILPYYRNLVADYDGRLRSVPLFAGSQLILLYRKDYLQLYDLQVPETWTEFIQVASVISNLTSIMGTCLGRLTEEGCRKRRQLDGAPCQSLSMSYLGMQLASMTQTQGTASGWWLEERDSLSSGKRRLEPLWNQTLDHVLNRMEMENESSQIEALQQDGQWNLEMFRKGMCAMTIVAHHPADLLSNVGTVGFAPLPGSLQVLDRMISTSTTGALQKCTTSSCPFGKDSKATGESSRYNRVPFGATDAVVGSVSAAAPLEHQLVVKDFLKFILTTNVKDAPIFREQPFRYSQLQTYKSTIPGYAELIESLTTNESQNAAIPFRIPEAWNMWTALDTGVHDYLMADNYTQDNRQQLRIRMEQTWEQIMDQHDEQFEAVPLSLFYQQSLGTFTPAPASNLYIGRSFRIAGWALGGIGMCMSMAMACWVYYYRKERVIRASQPMFLWMVCAGTLLMAASIFPFGIEDDIASNKGADMACMSGIWLYSLGFVTAFSALFSKIWRINRVSPLGCFPHLIYISLFFFFWRSY